MQIIIGPEGISLKYGSSTKTQREKGKSLTIIPDSYTVIDIETTGLDPRFDEIIEVGAIKVRNGKIENTFESLVKPNGYYIYDDNGNRYFKYVDDFITELTGITNEMLDNAPPIEDILPDFIDFIKDDILVGHNVNFDINFLYDNLCEHLNYKLTNNFVDLMRLARKIYPEFENHKLVTVATNLGVNIENKHRSLADCFIAYECFLLLSDYVLKNNIDLDKLFKKSQKGIDLTSIKANIDDINSDSIFYGKYCTFTGKLERMTRSEAAQLVANLGGYCLNSVTKQTNFLILGNFDYCSNIKGNKSSKLKKAESLILKGQDLQILSENVFYELINDTNI